ncbi:hypothetical protein [Romboutsia timonensis]|uniref:hypothetical protein n=1 Tax=Romboutsia timonensis TaxID=1776391 RepID=UPI002A8184AA|nr:hypothetical protein [Romboutsia timonensis]MDY3958481.1 hypothetical protein [Romboutsia timonensis]
MNIIPNLPILHSKKTVGKFVFTQNYLQSRMIDTYTALIGLIQCENNIKRASTISEKIEINNKKKECLDIINNCK